MNDNKQQQGVNKSCFLKAAHWPSIYLFLSLKERNHAWIAGKRELFALLLYTLWTCVLADVLLTPWFYQMCVSLDEKEIMPVYKMTQRNVASWLREINLLSLE